MTAEPDRREPPPELAPFATALAARLDVSPLTDLELVLGLAGTAAHDVVRPAAPVTAYLLGLAAAADPGRPLVEIADEIRAFIAEWASVAKSS